MKQNPQSSKYREMKFEKKIKKMIKKKIAIKRKITKSSIKIK